MEGAPGNDHAMHLGRALTAAAALISAIVMPTPLIRVHPANGEYWDSPSSTVLHLYGYAKAALTGQSPKTEQEKVDLHG